MGIHPAEAYEYLALAREKLFGWVGRLPYEQYVQEFPIGLGSIRATLVHMASAEWAYVRRLRNDPVPPPHERPFAQYATTEFAPLEQAWREQADQTRQVLRAVMDWSQPVVYTATSGDRVRRYRTTAAGIAAQLLFHEIHHRAQVMAMLRQLGVPVESLDYSQLMFQVEA